MLHGLHHVGHFTAALHADGVRQIAFGNAVRCGTDLAQRAPDAAHHHPRQNHQQGQPRRSRQHHGHPVRADHVGGLLSLLGRTLNLVHHHLLGNGVVLIHQLGEGCEGQRSGLLLIAAFLERQNLVARHKIGLARCRQFLLDAQALGAAFHLGVALLHLAGFRRRRRNDIFEVIQQLVTVRLGSGKHARGVDGNVAAPAQGQLQALHLVVG